MNKREIERNILNNMKQNTETQEEMETILKSIDKMIWKFAVGLKKYGTNNEIEYYYNYLWSEFVRRTKKHYKAEKGIGLTTWAWLCLRSASGQHKYNVTRYYIAWRAIEVHVHGQIDEIKRMVAKGDVADIDGILQTPQCQQICKDLNWTEDHCREVLCSVLQGDKAITY
jgi:hypothetical protein